MAITKIFIDEKSGEISIERATKSDSFDSLELSVEKFIPDGEKGWLVALMTQNLMAELMTKSVDQLQVMRLEQLNVGRSQDPERNERC